MDSGPPSVRRKRGELLSQWVVSRVFYNFLLVFLASLFLLAPIANRTVLGVGVGKLLAVAVIGAGILAVSQQRTRAVLGSVLGLAAMLAGLLAPSRGPAADTSLVLPVSYGLLSLFLLFVCACVFMELFRERRVSVGSLSGALCIYLLLGVAFGSSYELLDWFEPQAFAGLDRFEVADAVAHRQTEGLMYFSFVTLTTLGYGDITPVMPVARNLAMIEALLGQLVLVVLVARLVGMHASMAAQRD
jgi:hypothetical protein